MASNERLKVRWLCGQILDAWAEELAAHLGRAVEQVRSRGLGASDFPSDHDLRITWGDGSFAQFRHAFAVRSAANGAIAVFSEHCGYHVFPGHQAILSAVQRAGG
jgi:hypothetical protein